MHARSNGPFNSVPATPSLLAAEVLRQGIKKLVISQCVGAMDADLLVGGGAVERIIYGGGLLDRFGRLVHINRGIENGSLKAEEYSSLSIAFRYLAGSLGLPFFSLRSMRGSDLMGALEERNGSDAADIKDTFTGEEWLALKPLLPDVAVVQVQTADEEGSAWIMAPKWDNWEQVKASTRAIVIAEKAVSTEAIRQNPEMTVIPGLKVPHLVHQPFGAHPTAVYRVYDYDQAHVNRYVELSKTPETFKQYLDEYVFGVKDHWEYLDKIGGAKRMNTLKADPLLGY